MKWRHTVKSSKAELQQARDLALEVLQKWRIPSTQLFDFDLIICELLANAAEHGNGWRPDKKVYISMRWQPRRRMILIFVADEGRQAINDNNQTIPCSETGRGLTILNALVDQCRFGCGRVWVRKGVMDEKKNPSSR